MNLLFSVNRDYLEHLKECIYSISKFKVSEGYDIYILNSDFAQNDLAELEDVFKEDNIRFHYIYVNSRKISTFPKTKRYPEEIYYRIYAKEFLPDTIDRILYLDADTIVINSLETIYHIPFEDNYYLACTHVRKLLNKVNLIRLGISDECPYINSGVLLINLKKLREEQNLEKVEQYVEKYKNFLVLPDQDIITALYGKKVGILDSMKYNLSDRMITVHNTTPGNFKIDQEWVKNNTVIIHYYGKQKPWNENYKGILDKFYQENKRGLENTRS